MTKKHRKTLSIVIALAFLLTLVLPMGAALAAASATLTSSPTPLTEANLDGATLTITLSGDTFADNQALATNFTLNNEPTGLVIWNVQITGPRTATIALTFDGTDFDADITNFSVTIAAAELAGGSSLTTNDITIKAVREESITVTDDGNVREGQENSGKLIITLNGATFADPLQDPVSISGQPAGVQLETDPSKITRVSNTVIEVPITAAATEDYDADKTATITVPVNDLNGTTQPLTATYTFRATVERIDVSDDGQVVEGRENGEVLTLTLVGDTFKPDVALPGNVIMYGQPAGVGIAGVQYVDPTHVRIVLSGNATVDYDTDLTATIVVKQAGLTWNKGDIITSYVFRATVEGPSAVSDLDKIPRGFNGSFVTTSNGEQKNLGTATVRLPETTDVTRYADDVLVSVTLPDGVEFHDKPDLSSVTVLPAGLNYSLVYNSTKGLQVRIDTNPNQPLDFAVKFSFNNVDLDSTVSGDVKAAVEVIGLDGGQQVFTLASNVLIARVIGADEVSVSADTPASVTVGSSKKAATITITEAGYQAIKQGSTVAFEIVTPGATFAVNGSSPKVDVSPGLLTLGAPYFDTTVTDNTKIRVTVLGYATQGAAGKIELTPYLNIDPTASGEVKIKVTVTGSSGKTYTPTVTVANVVGAVAFTVSETKYTGGTVYAGFKLDTVKESGNAAQVTIKSVGGSFPSGTIVTVDLSPAKFDPDQAAPFTVSGPAGVQIQVFNNGRSAWFEVPSGFSGDEITLRDFNVYADADAATGDLTIKISLSTGSIDKPDVVIGKVAKPIKVEAAAAPEVTYLGRGQAAGDITITEAKSGALTIDNSSSSATYPGLKLVLPDGIRFAAKPDVTVTQGNIKVDASLTPDNDALILSVSRPSGVASTIKISNIKYDVNRLALDGDVAVKVVGYEGTYNTAASTWSGKTLATVVNAKVVSQAAAPAPAAPTKREASFVIGSTTYKVNGKDYTMDVAPYIDAASGRTYLPVRYVAYALGVSEDNIFYSNGQVSLLKDGRAVQMTIGSKALVVNGVTITMDAAPVIKDGRTMLPFRWIATALGASVSWDEATKTVTMTIE